MLRRELHPTASVPADTQAAPPNTLDFRSSDQTLDRYGEIISVAGWQLDNYRKNPVVQNAHSYWSLADTIGKSLITEIRSDDSTLHASTPYLFQRIQFAVEENPMAKLAYGLYKGGFLSAVSVGFIPIRWENGSQEAGYRRKYLEQELLEVSVVSIPANPNALTLGLKAGTIQKHDLKAVVDMLQSLGEGKEIGPRNGGQGMKNSDPDSLASIPLPDSENHFCNHPADPETNTRALGAGVHEAQWLQLTKQLHEIQALLKRA